MKTRKLTGRRVKGIENDPLVVDRPFCLASSILEGLAAERISNFDVGPTDSLSDEDREQAYDAFFGTSPLASPTPSPARSRASSPTPTPSTALSTSPSGDAAVPQLHVAQSARTHAMEVLDASASAHLGKRKRRASPAAALPIRPPPPPQRPLEAPPPLREAEALPPGFSGGTDQGMRNPNKAHERRRKKRNALRAQDPDALRTPRLATVSKYIAHADFTKVDYDAASFPCASTGFVALPDRGGSVHSLKELQEVHGFKLVQWDGKTPRAITDAQNRVIAVLAGHPDDSSWASVAHEAFDAIQKSSRICRFPRKARDHRRGKFSTLSIGISFGSGQTAPGNLYHCERNAQELKKLTSSDPFIRIAGFASSAFAAWAPRLHGYYESHFNSLLAHHPNLNRNFKKSVWAAAAINFGPKTVTAKHRDCANLPFGLCSITALGNFDPKKGGHLVLWCLGLIIEFPPGSTVLVPSAAVAHSNTPVEAHETRASFTQYSSGHLFRWCEHGFQLETPFKHGASKEREAEIAQEDAARCKLALSLFSTLDELRGI